MAASPKDPIGDFANLARGLRDENSFIELVE
jgi:hypothetical protein